MTARTSQLRAAAGLSLAAAAFALAWMSGAIRPIQENPFPALNNAALGLLCLWSAKRWQIPTCLAVGIVVRFLERPGAAHLYFGSDLFAILGTAGICGICLLFYRILSGDPDWTAKRLLLPVLVFWSMDKIIAQAMIALANWAPPGFDLKIYALDWVIAPHLASALASRVVGIAWVFNLVSTAYYALGAVMICVYAVYFYAPARSQANPMAPYLLNGFAGCSLYFLLPAYGPIYAFHATFPSFPPLLAAVVGSMPPNSVPNAMPSLHFSGALLAYFNSRVPWLRRCALVFVVLTGIATLGLGEHYVVDLIVAVPFAICLQSLAAKRFYLAASCAALVAAWFGIIILLPSNGLPAWTIWALTLASVFLGVAFERIVSPHRRESEAAMTSLSSAETSGLAL